MIKQKHNSMTGLLSTSHDDIESLELIRHNEHGNINVDNNISNKPIGAIHNKEKIQAALNQLRHITTRMGHDKWVCNNQTLLNNSNNKIGREALESQCAYLIRMSLLFVFAVHETLLTISIAAKLYVVIKGGHGALTFFSNYCLADIGILFTNILLLFCLIVRKRRVTFMIMFCLLALLAVTLYLHIFYVPVSEITMSSFFLQDLESIKALN